MAQPLYDCVDAFLPQRGAEALQAAVQRRQGSSPFLRVGLFTASLKAVVGQQLMGQATQVQVGDDASFAQHLVSAQPQRALQILEQYLDLPAILPSKME